MKTLHFKISIAAPKQKVWEVMLNDQSYREWTKIFNPKGGTYYEGKWEEGETMRFLTQGVSGSTTGMYSIIVSAKPYDAISLHHMGEVIDGKEKPWAAPEDKMFEDYTLTEKDGVTDLKVSVDTKDEHKVMHEASWPIALKKIKALSEQ